MIGCTDITVGFCFDFCAFCVCREVPQEHRCVLRKELCGRYGINREIVFPMGEAGSAGDSSGYDVLHGANMGGCCTWITRGMVVETSMG